MISVEFARWAIGISVFALIFGLWAGVFIAIHCFYSRINIHLEVKKKALGLEKPEETELPLEE
jgi:hypothetical protein